MASESITKKADAYLVGGKVRIVTVTATTVRAEVSGSDTLPYEVKSEGGVWRCSCPAQVSHCAHIVAVAKVVTMPDQAGGLLEGNNPQNELAALFDSLTVDETADGWKPW